MDKSKQKKNKSSAKHPAAAAAHNKQSKQPGEEHAMPAKPEYIRSTYKASGKLEGKVALITGGDSGIGRAISVHYAREGADIAIVYLDEDKDARETRELVLGAGEKVLSDQGKCT